MSKVHFVGAGPGDVELITLKGYKQLSEADVVRRLLGQSRLAQLL